jgi:hypothetical protein
LSHALITAREATADILDGAAERTADDEGIALSVIEALTRVEGAVIAQ